MLWCLAGVLPGAVLALVADRMGLDQLGTWVPDVLVALGVASVASVAGGATALLRLGLALRATRAARVP